MNKVCNLEFVKTIDLQNKKFETEDLPAPKLSKKKSQIDKEYWYCAHCTYANKKDKKKCEMCQLDKKVLTTRF